MTTQRRRLDPEERRALILDAARSAFAATPYGEASVPAIARAAGASPALVFHYFGSKAGLYGATVGEELDALAAAQAAADAALEPGQPARDRVRAWILTRLDHLADHPQALASGGTLGEEPAEATARRDAAREASITWLTNVIGTGDWPRHRYAIIGFLAFLDRCCAAWVEAGCPAEERHPLTDAALGALEGALGDWGR